MLSTTDSTRRDGTTRWAWREASRWSGAVFTAFLVAAYATAGTRTNPYSSSPQDYIDAYADGAGQQQLGRALGMVALIAFLWALARLRVGLGGARSGVAGALLVPAGAVLISSFTAALAASTALANAVETTDGFGADGFPIVPETAVLLDFVADGMLWTFMVASAVLAWGIALAGRRSGAINGWVSWVGLVLVPLLPFAWMLFFAPVMAFVIWFAVLVAVVPVDPAEG